MAGVVLMYPKPAVVLLFGVPVMVPRSPWPNPAVPSKTKQTTTRNERISHSPEIHWPTEAVYTEPVPRVKRCLITKCRSD